MDKYHPGIHNSEVNDELALALGFDPAIAEIIPGFREYTPDPQYLIDNAEIINGVPFVKLEEVIKWKKAFGRPKDLEDIKRIEEFLKKEE